MYKKTIYVLLIAVLITAYATEGKKSRRSRRPNNEEDTTPQPSVVSYSTFGFNDVGSYDGFVPTSPDYASYLSDNQESTTRLYAPAFPSSPDSTGFNNNFGSPLEGAFGNSDDSVPQSSMVQYPQSSVSFFNTPSFDGGNSPNANYNEQNRQSDDDPTGLVYGTKLNSKSKKNLNQFNHTEFNVYSSGPLANANDLASRFVMPGIPSTHEGKNPYGESTHDQNIHSFGSNYPSSDVDDFVKPASSNPHNALKFPRVIDFTNIKQFYPTEIDDKYQVASYSSIFNNQNENNMFSNNDEPSNKFIQPTKTIKDTSSFNTQYRDKNSDKESIKQSSYQNQEYSRPNFIGSSPNKPSYKGSNYNLDYKDNFKNKWNSGNYSNNEPQAAKMSTKGYEYSTDFSNTSFRYDFEEDKKPFNINTDELVPESSNLVDLTSYNIPDNDFFKFKKVPEIVKYPFDDDFGAHLSKDKYKNDEFINQFKNLYATTPAGQWGNAFTSNEYSYKHRPKKPQFDEINTDIVHIPKRPSSNYKYNFGKNQESKPTEWPKTRPYKSNKFEKPSDWNKEVFSTRFKLEEDLLGLRNHDTSHSSYIPPHRPNNNNDLVEQNDYKKLVEKWRQSYLKSKYKDAYRDYESYASEAKPLHVPIPKPYPIEVPHPVIVPVPQPYPVRVPVPKPVAVPVIRELTVPIEKPVPYPVIKKVPYPVEKPVPVPVEKEVHVPVVKPYPVHIPHVRPVFHHSRPPREDFDEIDADEDDYLPRPEGSKRIPPYKKRPRTTRVRPRRPTRTSYRDRNTRERRRWPIGYRPSETRSRRPPTEYHHSPPYKYHEFESEHYENEPTDYYYLHCKRTGNC
ncbi:putative uncharacterized protein DDB_G0282499 isoform X1 [Ostrinia furnacalis]|uniref:putative uncharacterized protein DDB_G0282499 isoform X1 n=1 Tax=Ostrinia furnacalis TaxID=93504 RepID=UPI0010402A3A|nr:putative uncharacterized protein DDB_G0282499 isoform X1 [Ostrinia furnacalis]